jgi:mannose-6-phosphate isomerase-like protein (cupin superfamily)
MPIQVVNFAEQFSSFDEYWSPRIAGELNENYVKLAKLKGEFVWHHHEHEDEMFLVVKGELRIRIRENGGEREVTIGPGEYVVIPRGIEHLPIADDEVHLVMVEPKTTLNTGNVRNERTRVELPSV